MFYAVRPPATIRALSPRQLPTDHDPAVPTRVYQRWDEKAGLRRDAVGSQVIDALEAQEIKETGNEED